MPIRESLRARLRRSVRLDLALRFVWQSTPGWTSANLVFVILQGVLPLVSLYLMKLMVDTVSDGVTAGASDGFLQDVFVVVGLMGAVNIFSGLVSTTSGIVNQAQSLIVSGKSSSAIRKSIRFSSLASVTASRTRTTYSV